jgi:type IV pilus assembly protein PilE
MTPVRQRGFTLIELMIVVVVLAIITGIAYPSYSKYVMRTRRADGQAALLRAAGELEKYYTQCGQYPSNVNLTAGGPMSACNGGLGLSTANSDGNNYTLAYAPGNAASGAVNQTYQLTAAPRAGGPQVNDSDCFSLTLDYKGTKGQTGPNTEGRCWQK